jgi:hypothetical protein
METSLPSVGLARLQTIDAISRTVATWVSRASSDYVEGTQKVRGCHPALLNSLREGLLSELNKALAAEGVPSISLGAPGVLNNAYPGFNPEAWVITPTPIVVHIDDNGKRFVPVNDVMYAIGELIQGARHAEQVVYRVMSAEANVGHRVTLAFSRIDLIPHEDLVSAANDNIAKTSDNQLAGKIAIGRRLEQQEKIAQTELSDGGVIDRALKEEKARLEKEKELVNDEIKFATERSLFHQGDLSEFFENARGLDQNQQRLLSDARSQFQHGTPPHPRRGEDDDIDELSEEFMEGMVPEFFRQKRATLDHNRVALNELRMPPSIRYFSPTSGAEALTVVQKYTVTISGYLAHPEKLLPERPAGHSVTSSLEGLTDLAFESPPLTPVESPEGSPKAPRAVPGPPQKSSTQPTASSEAEKHRKLGVSAKKQTPKPGQPRG